MHNRSKNVSELCLLPTLIINSLRRITQAFQKRPLSVRFSLTELLSQVNTDSMNIAIYSRVSTKDKGQYVDSCGLFKDAVISILATIAKQERVRLSERTVAGLQRAKQQGRVGGRPRIICDRAKVLELRQSGFSLGQIAAQMNLSKTTVAR